jgi:hypothetical protein
MLLKQVPMKRFLILLGTVMFVGGVALGQTGDLGAQIAAADAKLGAGVGEIPVIASGTISEGKVSLSVGHDLVCNDHITIFLNAGSYLYQNSHTRIKNCIISSTSTPISGEIQSVDTDHVELDNVTFVGGGNLVYWDRVNNFRISDNKVVSITAANSVTNTVQNGFYLVNCSQGVVDHLMASSFVFPVGPAGIPAILSLNLSHDITINNVSISNVDASFTFGGSGIQVNGSSHITIQGGVITHNAKMDGITTESWGKTTPSYDITITDLDASYNGGQGLNTGAPLSLGDGIDIINSGHVRISNCKILGSGYVGNQQPAIWLFLDDDVVVANSDLSDSSMGGIDIAGSQNVILIDNSINRNQASGTFSEAQIGTATSVGPKVTFAGGVSGSFGLPWRTGTPFVLDGVTYAIASVLDEEHIVLTSSPPDHPSPVTWLVNTNNEQLIGDVINDNGLGRFGGQLQVGISWGDATNGTISGVTAIDTGAGTQLYGLEFSSTASAILSGNTFSPNLEAGDGIFGSQQVVVPTNLSFPAQAVATTSSAQTVTFTAGAVVVQNLVVQVSGDFSQTNNCGTGLLAFGTCQVQLAFTPMGRGTLNGTLTVTDSAPNSPQTVLLTGTGVSSGLGLSTAPGGSNSARLAAGGTAKYSLSIGGAGMSGTASLSCTGAPTGATCNLPASVAISATQATAFTASVTSQAPSLGALGPTPFQPAPWLCALVMMGWIVLPTGVSSKHLARRYPIWLVLALLMFLCSCGGGNFSGTPKGTYTLMITAKLGSTSQQMPLMLLVQ